MKKVKLMIGMFALATTVVFSSCEKDSETPDNSETVEASELRTDEYEIGDYEEDDKEYGPKGKHCKGAKKKFFAQLTEQEKAKMEEIKPILEGLKEKKKVHFKSLTPEEQEKLKNKEFTKEEHQAIKAAFEVNLSAVSIMDGR